MLPPECGENRAPVFQLKTIAQRTADHLDQTFIAPGGINEIDRMSELRRASDEVETTLIERGLHHAETEIARAADGQR